MSSPAPASSGSSSSTTSSAIDKHPGDPKPIMATAASKDENNATKTDTKPKKKKPIQHLLAGGTAGLAESSICHPLDTIKTRMQLRRTNTMRKRALGSMREPATIVGKKEGALHRSSPAGTGTDRVDNETASKSKAAVVDGTGKEGLTNRRDVNANASAKNETVRVTPDASKAKSNAATAAAPPSNAPHDVGWKQRVPSAAEAASKATTSTAKSSISSSTKSSAAATSHGTTVVAPLGPFGTAKRIVQREGPMALYKGLTAVYTGIVPKMAIRFVSFEHYRDVLGGWHGRRYGTSSDATDMPAAPPPSVTFLAGLLSGLTEAVVIVTPAEVCKIRMQSQYHSLVDPSQMSNAKYKNVVQTAALVVKEEGVGALYKGVVPTMLRQGCNQAVNFTVYNWAKRRVLAWKRKRAEEGGEVDASGVQLDHWQSLMLGGLSGGMGPLVNNPLDVVKTRMQKQVIRPGKEPKYKSLLQSCVIIAKEEGTPALWKGITPRLMRIMPGQAITFMVYEAVSAQMDKYGLFD